MEQTAQNPPQWSFPKLDILYGFYIMSVSRNERCYAEQFFQEKTEPPIFDKFEFLKDEFK